ncbi:MAG: 16S rRNA (adenine(1518)-N(6)/adenine(1519)-N(6))-dimethyltransferase RsmA, partial [Proteobacteria bacterium]|nr:16S rRNA (adenine(1518)-N(6)/adenine(1519)-N(6))-dimethyltransferase RsmA [Pseudomonadota bacterium]NDD04618.1 16S rRNA (adenine(1518)-N(6)/adenine(1519)-N(6))-dimethyltransferase RsmA [Pseudomonadota bacterium]
ETIIAVIKAAFAHRRKKLASNLKERFPQNQWENKLSQLGLSPTIRAESLNFNQFETLAYKIK